LGIGEGGDYLSRWSRDLHPVKWIVVYYVFRYKPGEEYPQAAKVTVDGVTGKPLVLNEVETMTRETPLLLQVKDERPDMMVADTGYIIIHAFNRQEILKEINAVSNYVYRVGALSFSGGTNLITMK
jgi:hypothetical protein